MTEAEPYIKNYSVGTSISLSPKDFDATGIVPNKSIFLEYMRNVIFEKDANFIVIIEGKPACGKSVTGLGILERWCGFIGRTMTIKDNLVFGARNLMEKLADLQMRKANGEDIRGFPLLFDEAGISMDNREWHNHIHKILNDTTEVFRYLNLVFFITVPNKSRIDSKLRDLAHGNIKPFYVKKDEYSLCKLYLNDKTWDGKEILQRLRAQHHGFVFVIDSLRVKKPSARLMNEYKHAQEEFKGGTIQSGFDKIKKRESLDGGGEKKPLTDRQRQIYLLARSGIPTRAIATQLAISDASVGIHLRNIRAKGYET